MAGTEPTSPRPREQDASGTRPPQPLTVVVTLGEIGPDEIGRLCDQLMARLVAVGRPCAIRCDVAGVERPDVATVDAIARLTLTARRSGSTIAVVGANVALDELVALAGLSSVLRLRAGQSRRGGSPKSGKNVSVSRKNVIPAIPSSDTSRT